VKVLVNALDSLVRRLPWLVIIAALVITFIMGSFAGQFAPADNDNDSFAPNAEELLAIDEINELFGEESSRSVMQVIISSDSGDVITLDGLATVDAVRDTVLGGALAPFLIDQPGTGPVVHYLTPVEFALDNGAPVPTTDAALKAVYGTALADPDAPPELTGLATGLLPSSADIATASSPSGLLLVFSTGAASTDQADVDVFAAASSEAVEEIATTAVPAGMTVQPFSFELLFSDTSEFEAEISRLFATAGFIILLVLSIIFLIRPKTSGDRWLAITGLIALLVAVGILILPSLATLFPDTFPDSINDLDVGPVLAGAAAIYAIVYLMWTLNAFFPAFSGGLRRTTADTLVTILAIVMAITWMNGYGYLRFNDASGLVQILPILLIGLGVDYSIHMNSRYREEVSGGSTVDNGIGTAIRTVGVALVLATVTTAVGFLTNIFNDLAALREFGELAAFGIIVSFLLMLTFVPAIRLLVDRFGEKRDHIDPESLRGGESRRLPRLIGKASWLPRNAAIATLVVSIILGALGAWGTVNIEAKFSFLDFIPTTSPLRNTFATLLDEYGGGFGETTQVLICDFDQPEGADSPSCTDAGAVDTADAWNGMVAATNAMGDIDDVIKFGDFPAAQSPVSLYFQLANPEADLFDPAVDEAAQAAGIGADGMAAAGADVAPVYDAMFVAAPDEAAAVLFDAGGRYTSALFAIQTQGGEQGAAQLQEDLNEAFSGVSATGLSVIATSTEIISEIIITTLRDSQLQSLLLTLVAALILLVVNFTVTARRPMLGVITTVPVVLVVLLSFALMTLFRIPFGPVTATISALAIGIGIPYMIHITHRYEEDRARSASENHAIEDTLVHTGGALAGSALTTIAGFGILVTSSTIPFRQFGFVTAYTILLALLAAVLILPSYLVIWDRWHRKRGEDPIDVEAYEAAMQTETD
jgi:predicted RND superfamily exporter protein